MEDFKGDLTAIFYYKMSTLLRITISHLNIIMKRTQNGRDGFSQKRGETQKLHFGQLDDQLLFNQSLVLNL